MKLLVAFATCALTLGSVVSLAKADIQLRVNQTGACRMHRVCEPDGFSSELEAYPEGIFPVFKEDSKESRCVQRKAWIH